MAISRKYHSKSEARHDREVPSQDDLAGVTTRERACIPGDLRLFLLTYVCVDTTGGNTGAWLHSTATSLERQDWTPPQMILNSQCRLALYE